MKNNIQNFFNPRSVAVIGASADKNKVGYAIMANLLSSKSKDSRKIYPISLSEKEILGIPTLKSIKDVPDTVDLVVIAVRADFVPQILADCGEKKIPTAIIIAAGFREVGPAGRELEEKCALIAKEKGIALLGPNCLGTIDANSDFNASFAARPMKKGNIAFLSQSGALGTSLLDMAEREGVGFSKFVSLGNEARLSEIEFLEYFANDEETKSILIYLEKLSDGPEFMRLCAEITKKKPIVVLKAGRSARGIRAVASHTGSLAPEDSVFSAALRQTGVIAVESIREFFNMAKLFELGITTPLQQFVILTNGGGPSVVTADLVDLSTSLSLTELSSSVRDELKKVLPTMAAVGNPVDIIGDALSARYQSALEILVEVKEVDGIILMLTPQMMTEVKETAKLILESRSKKPIIPVFLGGPSIEDGVKLLQQNGLVNFSFPKDAVGALDNLALGMEKKKELSSQEITAHKSSVRHLQMMSFSSMMNLLDKYGIELNGVLSQSKKDIIGSISKLGKGPYVMKAISQDIIHKTDAGVVRLNIKSVEEAEKVWDSIHEIIENKFSKAKIEGIFIQTMNVGKETIIGMKRDPVFGPAILFGLGGIFTETLKDTSMRIAPVSTKMALDMIGEIRNSAILKGLRGEKPVDMDGLADLLVKISKLAIEHPEIMEIDLNPVMATPSGVLAVDARMMILEKCF